MQEFIHAIAKQLGIDEATAEKATAIILGFIKSKLASGEFGQLASKIPGLAKLAEKERAAVLREAAVCWVA